MNWPDTPEQADQAVGEWRAAWRGQPVTTAGPETSTPAERLWQVYADDVARLGEQLRTLDPDDHATWARVARETSGVLAAWSLRTETTPGPLAEASQRLADGAALHRRAVTQRPGRPVSLRGPALLLLQLAANPSSVVGQALLIRQVARTVRALHSAHVATSQARDAAQLAEQVRAALVRVAEALPDEPARPVLTAAEAVQADRPAPMGRPYAGPISAAQTTSEERPSTESGLTAQPARRTEVERER